MIQYWLECYSSTLFIITKNMTWYGLPVRALALSTFKTGSAMTQDDRSNKCFCSIMQSKLHGQRFKPVLCIVEGLSAWLRMSSGGNDPQRLYIGSSLSSGKRPKTDAATYIQVPVLQTAPIRKWAAPATKSTWLRVAQVSRHHTVRVPVSQTPPIVGPWKPPDFFDICLWR